MAIDLSKFTPKQIAAIVELDHREQARESLIASCCFFDSKYIPSRTGFHRKMAEALEAVERGEIKQLIISTPPQHGKLIADDTPVLTANGWQTHGALKPGDLVVGGDGAWTTVVAVSEAGTADMEVRFNDGSAIQCHAKHEWKVRRNWTGRRDWKVLETQELVRNWNGKAGSRGCRAAYSIDTVAVTGTEVVLKVNPYVLGAWLGDGSSSKGALTFHPKDQEPFAEFKKHYRVTSECVHAQTTCVTAYFDSLKQDLKSLGVLDNKHIPGIYFTASRSQRLELLAGLMDTDGYICHRVRRAVFSNCNKELAQDVATLVIGLGWRATMSEFAPVKSSSGIQGKQTVYQVSFSPDAIIPCRIPRKRNVAFNVVRRLRSIEIVSACAAKRGKCIQVASADGIYLVGRNLIPTHNSRLAAQEFVTWFLGRNPTKRVILSSYASGLAEKNGMICRNRVADPRFRALFGTGLSESRYRIGTAVRRIDEWYLENGIGGVKSVGVGSGITGFSADLCIIDDPVKGWEEAHSLTIRENVWNWFLSDLTTRKSEGAPVIFIMTRWHQDDIVGRLLDPKRQEELRMAGGDPNWTVLNLTGIAKGSDPLNRKPGEALFPEMKSAEFIRSQMAILGPYLASALYDGNPVAIGGNYIDPADLIVKSSDEVPQGLSWCRAWDLAATEQEDVLKNDPDYTVGIQGALDGFGNLWLRRMVRGQWKWPKTREAIRSTAASEYAVPVGVEAVGGFKTAFDNLAEVVPPTTTLREYGVDRNKLTRALPWTALAARKKVFLVAGEWVPEFKAEAQAFPGGAHDDQIDAVSLVHEMLMDMSGYGGVALVDRTERERTVDGQDFFSEREGDRGERRLVL